MLFSKVFGPGSHRFGVRLFGSLIVAGSVFACSTTANSPTSSSSGTDAPTGSTSQPGTATSAPTVSNTDSGPPTHVGNWISPSCGNRAYSRYLDLHADGTFEAKDLVSPCPPNVACVWSGIVNRQGTYKVAGNTLTLTMTENGGQQGAGLPLNFSLEPVSRAPIETDSEAKACVYNLR